MEKVESQKEELCNYEKKFNMMKIENVAVETDLIVV